SAVWAFLKSLWAPSAWAPKIPPITAPTPATPKNTTDGTREGPAVRGGGMVGPGSTGGRPSGGCPAGGGVTGVGTTATTGGFAGAGGWSTSLSSRVSPKPTSSSTVVGSRPMAAAVILWWPGAIASVRSFGGLVA